MNSSVLRNSSRNRPLNDSAKPFSHGDPGWMLAVLVVSLASYQLRRAWAMNTGLLSLRMNTGAGYRLMSPFSMVITSLALQRLPTG